jgi:N-methylhydantoinase A
MRVGPASAGAVPGPACYGRGGTKPTVSDAAVVLGYFDPEYFLGGKMPLDVAAARKAVSTVATQIGLSIEETAFRILGLATDLMMRAISDVTINDGIDPRNSTIVAGGGAAGVNILAIAHELGCKRVVLPRTASALSASGMQFADIVGEEAASLVMLSTRFDFARVNVVLDEIAARLEKFRTKTLRGAGTYKIEYFGEARYLSQVWELDTKLPSDRFRTQSDLDQYLTNFHDLHERVFAVRDSGSPIETVSWKARMTVQISPPRVSVMNGAGKAIAPITVARPCYFGEAGFISTKIHKASDLSAGQRIEGPAVVEEATTTLVISPGMQVTISPSGNYLLDSAS